MKECKNICQRLINCCEEEKKEKGIVISGGNSPGRCNECNKRCSVCNYWIKTEEIKCDCCNNILKERWISKIINRICKIISLYLEEIFIIERIYKHVFTQSVPQDITT